jgi:hypothetical protein
MIQCSGYIHSRLPQQQNHYQRAVIQHETMDMAHLQYLFERGSDFQELCNVVEQKKSRRRWCGK